MSEAKQTNVNLDEEIANLQIQQQKMISARAELSAQLTQLDGNINQVTGMMNMLLGYKNAGVTVLKPVESVPQLTQESVSISGLTTGVQPVEEPKSEQSELKEESDIPS